MNTDEQIGCEAGQEARQETKAILKKQGITVEFIANRLWKDLHRKETKTFKLKGTIFDYEQYIEEKAAEMLGQKIPKAKKRAFKILAKSSDEAVVAVDMDCIDAQIDTRKDAEKLLGLYVDQVELSGPGGGPIAYDSITPEERDLIRKSNRIIQKLYEGKNGKGSNHHKKKNRDHAGKAKGR